MMWKVYCENHQNDELEGMRFTCSWQFSVLGLPSSSSSLCFPQLLSIYHSKLLDPQFSNLPLISSHSKWHPSYPISFERALLT